MTGNTTNLQETSLEILMSEIGRATPSISGSTASLLAAQIGSAMARMALVISSKHGGDNGLAVERLDSIVGRIKEAAERDREASSRLIEALKRAGDGNDWSRILRDATREPLSAAYLIVELLEVLTDRKRRIHPSVNSDFLGAVELLSGAFAAVMMGVDSNIARDKGGLLLARTAHSCSLIRRRHDAAMKALRVPLD